MNDPQYKARQFEIPSAGGKLDDRYVIPSEQIQRLIQNPPRVLYRQALDLSTAQSSADPLEINVPGRAVAIFPYTLSSKYDPVTNTGIQTFEPGAFVWCMVNQKLQTLAFPLKAGRGFRGEFAKLFLAWPAQADFGCDLIVYEHEPKHWEAHEFDSRFSSVEASQVDTLAVATTNSTASIILPADVRRKISTVQNLHATEPLFVGDSSVTVATGIQVNAAGGICYWRNTAALYGISTNSNNAIRLVTEY